MPRRQALAGLCGIAAVCGLQLLPSRHNEVYTMELSNFHNIQYYAPLTVGGQTLPVIYDTGSFEVIVLSKLCTRCSNSLVYNNENSSTFTRSDSRLTHYFGSGPVYSQKGFDTIRIGGAESPYVTQDMPFWQVMRHQIGAWNNPSSRFSGIVGLGHSDRVPKGYGEQDAETTTLLAAVEVDNFAVCLERSSVEAPGRLVFGVMRDPGFRAEDFHRLDVKGKTHWAVTMTNLSVEGSVEARALCQPGCGAIVDSGTSLLATPPQADEFVSELERAVEPDCSNIQDLPVIRLSLGGVPVELPPGAWVVKRAVTLPTGESAWACKAAFMPIKKASKLGPVWILGMPFLRYYYTVFDREANQLHIAKSQPNCELEKPNNHLTKGSGEIPGVGGFAEMDYRPLSIDAENTLVPRWATDEGASLDI